MIDKCDIGVIGLAVMGQNLILNINDKGFSVAVYNEIENVDDFLNDAAAKRDTIIGTHTLKEFCGRLLRPRKILLMVRAGEVVDDFIESLLPLLEPGDCVIDGGNSFFKDTVRRHQYLNDNGIIFCGMGISGGEEGARRGPSLMPGGDERAWPLVKEIFRSISAKTPAGEPCCEWIGSGGAGHFVKMVHNGIEYGDMQLISEAYSLLKIVLGMSCDDMADTFSEWNRTELESYLIKITGDILRYRDSGGHPLVEKILDSAGQKGTGKWMSAISLEFGAPATLVTEAVYARMLSSMVDERKKASLILKDEWLSSPQFLSTLAMMLTAEDIRKALLASKIVSYAQGFMLMSSASEKYSWNLDPGNIALLWRSGCIIRSVFLDNIKNAYRGNPSLQNMLFDDYFRGIISSCQSSWRSVVSTAVTAGIAVPALSSALCFYDSYRCGRSAANLLQAQRDYFGAHTYERTDMPRGNFFHTDWTGEGGNAASNHYTV
ncbi:MAG: decarboxylating NADP(+)-dependent phosphogluconate dehydrogenase [Chitinispirillia bacterium]|nr:decarboxylating NADP(+)-dependent phosphogluconate dehydrogenase [Chitinispirillia bacterium]MCL2268004.1 decarboxylating NADP(+)-dependent phosphogluconate dehydrogenase [Chitinispirillia bacterium]